MLTPAGFWAAGSLPATIGAPMVRLISQSKPPAAAQDGVSWDVLPSALWDLDFTETLAWIDSQGCKDADEFKQLVRKDPEALTK